MILVISFLDSNYASGPFGDADIFNTIFSTFGAGRNPFSGFQNIVDLDAHAETHLRLSFMEAALGCKKTIKYKRNVSCSSCNGSGSAKGSSPSICPSCKGTGQKYRPFAQPCYQCSGFGRIITNPCGTCKGLKTTQVTEEIELNIPAGITEDFALQFKGKGNQIGKAFGDLIIRLSVQCSRFSNLLLCLKLFRSIKATILKEKAVIYIRQYQ